MGRTLSGRPRQSDTSSSGEESEGDGGQQHALFHALAQGRGMESLDAPSESVDYRQAQRARLQQLNNDEVAARVAARVKKDAVFGASSGARVPTRKGHS